MSVFKKQRGSWIDYDANAHRKRERMGPAARRLEVILGKHTLERMGGPILRGSPVTQDRRLPKRGYLESS